MKFLGDAHGNINYVFKYLQNDSVFVLGDFGYWPHERSGIEFLDAVDSIAAKSGTVCYFLDGNHENHDELDREFAESDRDYDGFVKIRQNIRWAYRGHRWLWGKNRYMALGGAYSIDKEYRTIGESWWPGERITPEQLEYALRPGDIDILLTHDCTTDYPFRSGMVKIMDSHINQQMINTVIDEKEPALMLHGHMHNPAEYLRGDTRIFGLNYEGGKGSAGRIYHEALFFEWLDR